MPIVRQTTPRGLVPIAFDRTINNPPPVDLLTVPAGLQGVSVTLTADRDDARIAFDETASANSMLLMKNQTYHADDVTIRNRISMIADSPGRKLRVFGLMWCTRV